MWVRKLSRAPSVARYRPTSCSKRRRISLGGLRYGRQFHCRPALRRPGLFMPRLSRVLGTRSPPLASYLAQRCPTSSAGFVSATVERASCARVGPSSVLRHDHRSWTSGDPCVCCSVQWILQHYCWGHCRWASIGVVCASPVQGGILDSCRRVRQARSHGN